MPQHEGDPGAITLRPIQEDDGPLLFRVYASTREVERDAWQWENEAWDAFLRMQFEAQRRHYSIHFPDAVQSIVLRAGEPAGRTWVYRSTEEIRLLDIAILPEHRRCGIGTHLIRQLQDEARQAAVPLHHSVEFGNPGARRLYERLGFVAVQTHGMHTLMEWHPNGE
jgi:GNAT superfamily N-acetyltransferase